MKHWLLRGITMNDFLWYSLEVQLKSKSWFNGPTRNYWTCSSDSKESAWNTGDPGSIPGLERSSGEGTGYPLQYSWASLVAQMVNAGDLSLIPGLGRSPGGWHSNPLQYSCLENPHGQRSLAGCSPWGRKESDTTEQLAQHASQTTNTD